MARLCKIYIPIVFDSRKIIYAQVIFFSILISWLHFKKWKREVNLSDVWLDTKPLKIIKNNIRKPLNLQFFTNNYVEKWSTNIFNSEALHSLKICTVMEGQSWKTWKKCVKSLRFTVLQYYYNKLINHIFTPNISILLTPVLPLTSTIIRCMNLNKPSAKKQPVIFQHLAHSILQWFIFIISFH